VQDSLPVLEIGLVLLAAALAGALSRRAGLPAVLGYLAVGLLVGPFTPGYVADRRQIQVLADVGVVLLLFEVGIELDLRALRREPAGILLAAPLQVALVAGAAATTLPLVGMNPLGALTIGLAVAFSSTVVAVNITRSRRRTTDSETARAIVVWAILQDVVAVVAVALLAVLLPTQRDEPLAVALGKLLGFAGLAVAIHGVVVPWLLRRLRDEPDSFLIVAVSVALATAGIGSVFFGVPLALAAFVGGLVLSIQPEAREARREVLPFRDLFAVLFFVAIGSLVDPAAILLNLGPLLVVLGLIVAKVLVVWLLAAVFRIPARGAQLGVSLGQIGEISFVVGALGAAAGVVTSGEFSAVLLAAALTISATAVGARLFPQRAERAPRGTIVA